mgnify:FL=1
MSDAKNSEGGGDDLDFNIFSAPIPETLPRASWRSRSKAGVQGTYKNDVAVAERDNRKAFASHRRTRRKRTREQEAKRDAAEWQREIAMEAGMLGGCDAYNEAMGWD